MPGGTHMLRYMGMCCPNRLVFYQGPIFIKKSFKEDPIWWKLQKNVIINRFLKWKIGIRNGSWFLKMSKKQSNQPPPLFFSFLSFFFWGRKILRYGWCFRPQASHCQKNNLNTPPELCFQVKILLFFRTSSVMHRSIRFTPATCLIFLIYRVQSSLM